MKERHLKVYESTGTSKTVPRINLQGDWLSDLGFRIGDRIIVSYNQGRLIIEPENIISEPLIPKNISQTNK